MGNYANKFSKILNCPVITLFTKVCLSNSVKSSNTELIDQDEGSSCTIGLSVINPFSDGISSNYILLLNEVIK